MRAVLSLVLAVSVVFWSWPHSVEAQAACRFALGFETMRNLVGADKVGNCLEDERINAENGNTEQRTTGGLLVWRKADGITLFTDGGTTWVNGPNGLQSRPNNVRFAWETDPPAQAATQQSASTEPAAQPPVAVSPTLQSVTTSAQPFIDPRLVPALELLYTVNERPAGQKPLGEGYRYVVETTRIPIRVGALPDHLRGGFSIDGNGQASITLNETILKEDNRVIASVLAHELTHAGQYLIEGRKSADCISLEAEAFRWEGIVWASFFDNPPSPRTKHWEELNEIANTILYQGDPGIYAMVTSHPGYQHLCRLYVPPFAQATATPTPTSRPREGDLSRRCDAVGAALILSIMTEGNRNVDSPEKAARAVAKLCREDYAEPHGSQGVACLEASLSMVAPLVREMDPRDKEASAKAITLAIAFANKCVEDL